MIKATLLRFWRRFDGRIVPAIALLLVAGCASGSMLEMSDRQRLSAEVRAVLGTDRISPEYQLVRNRLEEMGPEIDAVLVDLVEDRRARPAARADALILLADRRSPLALPILSRALGYENDALRSAAVLGLNRLVATSDAALELIRAATRDPARLVRLNALQSLDIREVETIRALLERESDPEVREIAVQLVSLAEARGAPLMPDFRGALRTAGGELDPQIVFRPVGIDSVTAVSSGDLRLEIPGGRDIPLAASATVVADVVPAFFSPDRSAVLAESDGQIYVVDIDTRSRRTLGPGLAPRLIPFTQHFVFLREQPGQRARTSEGTEVVYEVFQASFGSHGAEHIGELRAWLRDDRHGGESPVRWMVVGDSGEGFVLRAEGIDPFRLPTPVWGSAVSGNAVQP